jgi:hypothetical protein
MLDFFTPPTCRVANTAYVLALSRGLCERKHDKLEINMLRFLTDVKPYEMSQIQVIQAVQISRNIYLE